MKFVAIFAVAAVFAGAYAGIGDRLRCRACESTLKLIHDGIQNSAPVQQKVVSVIVGWCKKIAPRLGKEETYCNDLALQGSRIVQQLLEKLDSKNCQTLKLCEAFNGMEALEQSSDMEALTDVEQLGIGDGIRQKICDTCVATVTKTRELLLSKLPQFAEKMNLCGLLQKPDLVEECKANLAQHIAELAKFITGEAEPRAICVSYHLCQA